MPNITGDQLTFNIDSISDNQILVYDGDSGIFVAQDSLSSNANAAVASASNVGASGVGVFKEKDGSVLKFKNIAPGTNTTVTEDTANGLIKINATQYSPTAPLQLHNNNGNVFVAQGQNYGANANVAGFIGVQSSNSYGTYSDSTSFDGHTRFRIGSNDLVDVELTSAHGLILSTAQNSDGHIQVRSNTNIEFYAEGSLSTNPDFEITGAGAVKIGNSFTMPTSDGTTDQVLATYGNGVVHWKTITVPSFTESSILAKTVRLDQTSVPTVTNSFDIGSTTRQFYEVHANYFKGQADTAIQIYNNVNGTVLDDSYILGLATNASNLSGLSDVAQARTNLGVYSKAEANALVSGATQTNSFVRLTDGTNTASAANTNDVFTITGGTDITATVNATTNVLTIDSTAVAQNAFKHIFVSGESTISADSSSDGLTFAAGSGIQITTDENTDTITITNSGGGGSGGASEAFKNIAVAGQTTVVADASADTVTFVAGSGMTITTDATSDSVTFASTGGSGNYGDSNVATFLSTNSYSNVAYGNTEVQAYLDAQSYSNVAYGNAQVQAYLDAQSYSNVDNDSQTLSWDVNTRILSISGGNSANLSVMEYSNVKVQAYLDAQGYSNVDNDAQAISISGNVISITGNASTVDLTSALGSVTSDYGDSNVASFLSTNSYSNVAYGNTEVQNYLTVQGYDTKTNIIAEITDSAPATLDTLNELAAALGDDPNFATTTTNSIALKANSADLSTVATSGDFDDLTNVPVISLAGSDLTFDGTTVDLSGVGAVGPQGNAGVDAPTISSASLSGDNLQLTLSNSTVLTAGNVRGPVGPTGATGVGITNTALVSSNLTITYSNTSVQDLGNIRGPQGAQGIQGIQGNAGVNGTNGTNGTDGVSVSSAALSGDNLTLTLSNSTVLTAGNVRGAQGPQGPQGNVGPAGADGALQTLSVSGNIITISGNDDTVDLTTMLAPYSKTDTDAQDLSISGNVISLTGQSGNVDLTSLLASGGGTPGGSDGQLQYNNGGSFGGIADLHWDDSNDRLGIGTSSPAVKLHISGDAAQESQLRMSQYNNTADAPDIRFFKARGTEASPSNISTGDKLAALNVEARTGGAFSEVGTISFVSSSTNTGASLLKFGTKSNSETSEIYPSTKFEITEEGNIKFNNTYTFPSSDGTSGQVLQTDGSGTLSFATVSGGGSSYADSDVDTHLNTSTAGTNEVLSWNGSDYDWVAQSGGGGSVTRATHWEEAKITYSASDNTLTGNANISAGISSVTIPGSGYGVTFNFTGYTNPPHSIILYGYDAVNNQYYITHVDQNNRPTMPGNGSAGSPTAFGDFSNSSVTVDVSTTNTGGQRDPGGFGSPAVATHTWVRFIMGD